MLIGALGCNIAWGVIDGLLYLMGCLAEKGRSLSAWHALRKAPDEQEGQRLISQALPPVFASVLEPSQLEAMRRRLVELPEPSDRPRLTAEDWRGFIGVLLLVFVSTLPVVMPFVLMSEAHSALRVSNAIAITMLFLCGYVTGRLTRYHPWGMGVGMVVLGSLLVAMTMALGG
jgi:VIT1/CCC1 family predicted Fe2+/Mn2+ transporter